MDERRKFFEDKEKLMRGRRKVKYLHFWKERVMIPLTDRAWKEAYENYAKRPYRIAVIYEPIKKK